MNGAVGQPKLSVAPVVAFDFDGTLTCRDSFVAFLAWRAGLARFLVGLVALLPALGAYAIHRDRGAVKAEFVRRFLGGVGRAELEQDAQAFANTRLEALMRPDALACWRDWRARGATLLIVTASPELLVAPFARALGADGLIGTRLDVDSRDRITGQLVGPNCRGPEKVARLRERLGRTFTLAAAYGDSSGDREMLAMAIAPGMRAFSGRP